MKFLDAIFPGRKPQQQQPQREEQSGESGRSAMDDAVFLNGGEHAADGAAWDTKTGGQDKEGLERYSHWIKVKI